MYPNLRRSTRIGTCIEVVYNTNKMSVHSRRYRRPTILLSNFFAYPTVVRSHPSRLRERPLYKTDSLTCRQYRRHHTGPPYYFPAGGRWMASLPRLEKPPASVRTEMKGNTQTRPVIKHEGRRIRSPSSGKRVYNNKKQPHASI